MPLRVVTFNMQNGQPWDEADHDSTIIDIESTGAFLKSLDADIICLQEVEQGHDGGFQIEPPPNYTWLKRFLAMYESVFSYPLINETELPFGLGLAIFSRTPLMDFKKTDLPAGGMEFEFGGKKRHPSARLLLEASTTFSGRRLRILNTHLQAFFMIGSSSEKHPEQRALLESRLRKIGTEAAILAGDMNSAPGETLVAQFENVGFRTVQNEKPTWRRMPYVMDHIFHSAPLKLIAKRIEQTSASDHHAVVAEFEFQ